MSRTPASHGLTIVRGSTWEDEFTYTDENGAAVDLTGYEARMQVRTDDGRYGTTGAESLLLELSTANGMIEWDTADIGRLRITVPPAGHAALNPDNERKARYAYAIEVFKPADGEIAEYVIPLVGGNLTVLGEITR